MMAGGLPAEELFPRRPLAEAFLTAVARSRCEALQYGWPEGDEGLRRWIARRLAARGVSVTTEQVLVTSGAQQALAIAAALIGLEGKTVGVDAVTYPGALDLFRSCGARFATEDPSREERSDLFYVMPGASNPRGEGLSEARSARLLETGKPLVVDEAYAELRFDGQTPRPLIERARDRVFHIGTLSKTLSPGLRVGWLIAPPHLAERALTIKRDMDLQASSLGQSVAAAYLETGDYDSLVLRARVLYASRCQRLQLALERADLGLTFHEPEGGFSIFVETNLEGIDEARALSLATAHKVSFDPGSMFRPDGATSPFAMRLSCSSLETSQIDDAVDRLKQVLLALAVS